MASKTEASTEASTETLTEIDSDSSSQELNALTNSNINFSHIDSGAYNDQLLQLYGTAKEKILSHCPISVYFPNDLVPPLEELWKMANSQLSSHFDSDFMLLLNECKMIEKLKSLDELNQKYSTTQELSPSWQYTGLPEQDCQMISQQTAGDILPQYQELYDKEREETEELLKEYREHLSLLNRSKRELETQLTEIENDL